MSDHSKLAVADSVPDSTWNEIRIEFLAGRSAAELSEKYGVKASRISKRATRGRWVAEREKFSGAIADLSDEQYDQIKRSVRNGIAVSYPDWLAHAEASRKALLVGDFESFNTAVSALTKLHASAQRHFGLTDSSQVALIVAGDIGGRAEEDAVQAVDVEQV